MSITKICTREVKAAEEYNRKETQIKGGLEAEKTIVRVSELHQSRTEADVPDAFWQGTSVREWEPRWSPRLHPTGSQIATKPITALGFSHRQRVPKKKVR